MKKTFTNALIALMAVVCCGFSLKAQEYPTDILSVPSAVNVNAEGVATLPISLNNTTGAVSGIQISLAGTGVSFAQPEWTSRVSALYIKEFRNNMIVLVGTDDLNIPVLEEGQDAVIAYVPVTFNEGNAAQSVNVTLSGSYVPVGSNDTDVTYKTVTTSINKVQTCALEVPASVLCLQDTPTTISVGLANDFTAGVLAIRFTLPEGVELASNTAVKGERVTSGTSISNIVRSAAGVYSVTLMNFSGATLSGNTGTVLSFDVKATTDLAEGAQISWEGSEASSLEAELYVCTSEPTILYGSAAAEGITNAYDADVAKMNEIAQAFQEFVNSTSENFPGYLTLKSEEVGALSAGIQSLNDQITAALEAAGTTGVYNGPAAEDFTALSDALTALQNGLEETITAIQEANDADVAKLQEITVAFQEFVNSTSETFPGYLTLKSEEVAALTAAIESLNGKINAAMEAAYETGVYTSPADEDFTAASDALTALQNGLEETIAAIQAAYDADIAKMNELAQGFTAFQAAAEESFPGYLTLKSEEVGALSAAIESLNGKITAAMEAAFETGVYTSPAEEEFTAASDALTALTEGMAEAQAAIEAEAQADAEKLAAYAAQVEPYTEDYESDYFDEACILYQHLVTVFEEVGGAMTKAISETGVYETPLTEEVVAEIESAIETLKSHAAIATAYNADVAMMNELAQTFQEFVDSTSESFAGYLTLKANEVGAVSAAIQNLNSKIAAALEASYETGEYNGPAEEEFTAVSDALAALTEGVAAAKEAIENEGMADAQKLADYAAEVEPYTEDYEAAYFDQACILYQSLANLFEQVGAAMTKAYDVTGVYESPLTEAVISEIESAIAALKETVGLENITVGQSQARYFDLNGYETSSPAAGQVYIKVEGNKASKVIIK